MTSGPLHIPAGFEDLFDPCYVPYADTDIVGTLAPPDFDLVHRVHLISQPAPGQVTVCESAEGWRFLPGGRREPNETVHEAIARELREEAGTVPTGPIRFFFSHVATSRRHQPYLPHVPHPVTWWTFGLCTTRIVGSPTAPTGAEQIVAVHRLPVAQAITWLAADTTDREHQGRSTRRASRVDLKDRRRPRGRAVARSAAIADVGSTLVRHPDGGPAR